MEPTSAEHESQKGQEVIVDFWRIRPLAEFLMRQLKPKIIEKTISNLDTNPQFTNKKELGEMRSMLGDVKKTINQMRKAKQVKLVAIDSDPDTQLWAFNFSEKMEEDSILDPGYIQINPPLVGQLRSAMTDAFNSPLPVARDHAQSLLKLYSQDSSIKQDLRRILGSCENLSEFMRGLRKASSMGILTNTEGRSEISFGFEPTNQSQELFSILIPLYIWRLW